MISKPSNFTPESYYCYHYYRYGGLLNASWDMTDPDQVVIYRGASPGQAIRDARCVKIKQENGGLL